jgi:hypothetical protein
MTFFPLFTFINSVSDPYPDAHLLELLDPDPNCESRGLKASPVAWASFIEAYYIFGSRKQNFNFPGSGSGSGIPIPNQDSQLKKC